MGVSGPRPPARGRPENEGSARGRAWTQKNNTYNTLTRHGTTCTISKLHCKRVPKDFLFASVVSCVRWTILEGPSALVGRVVWVGRR